MNDTSARFNRACLIMFLTTVLVSMSLSADLLAEQPTANIIGFNRHIRPILSDTCSQCHGPDKGQRKGELRLDTEEGLFSDRGDHHVVEPGKPLQSELFRRITSNDPDERMPPAGSEHSLTSGQIELIRRWIEQGAAYEQHWAFIRPTRPELSKISDPTWCETPIDSFVLARLDQENLTPSKPADRVTLLRRVTLDLTGLPPTVDEVESFLADKSPAAYERVVDRLLQSPRFGERMAIRWLDLARYADTSGYQNDGPRYMWRWRDWVIDAYNAGMPFDQFTTEQLAGDMLANWSEFFPRNTVILEDESRLNQVIASAFNRNHRGNAEGGIIAEEYQVEYVVDRVETTATAWLGLTIGCARCHDHKYDPFSQKEFYSLYAYFNNIPEYGRAIKEGNSPPYTKAPTPHEAKMALAAEAKLDEVSERYAQLWEKYDGVEETWEETFRPEEPLDWTVTDGLVLHHRLDGDLRNETGAPMIATASEGDPKFAEGKIGQAADLDGKQFINSGDVAKFGYFDSFTITAWVYPLGDGTIVSRMTPEPQGDGYYVHLRDGHIQVNLVKRWLDDSIRIESKQKLDREKWQFVAVTYDGSRRANGININVDGTNWMYNVEYDFLNQTFTSDQPLRIGAGHSNFQGRIDDVRIYNRNLETELLGLTEVRILAAAESIDQILKIASDNRTLPQKEKLHAYYTLHHAPEEIRQAYRERDNCYRTYFELHDRIPTLMVMQESIVPRETHVLVRGQYDKPGEAVYPDVPKVLGEVSKDVANDRLSLAKWLVDPSHPLTARVAVNRYWQMFFGEGLVATMEDFGVQGARPTHPELLDWLATEFIRTGWDVKAMHKLIVMSATYRQSSQLSPELQERDPSNALLARGPRLRLPAELIRDQALAASGLMTEQLGGPSVKIYQPEGLWNEIATDTAYDISTGADLYRRSLYTYWKRTVSPPTMATFDAPSREACVVRRPLTNTPLQALSLLNDPTYLEAARVLAERVMNDIEHDPERRIRLAFRMVVGREPRPMEKQILLNGLQTYLDRYVSDPDSAKKLVSVGQSKYDDALDACELAAYTTVASILLNLDETVTKE